MLNSSVRKNIFLNFLSYEIIFDYLMLGSLGFFGALAGVFSFGLEFNSLILSKLELRPRSLDDEGFMKISNLKLNYREN